MTYDENNTRPDEVERATDRLVEQDRLLVEARMLPTEGKLTADHVASVREALLDHITGADGRRRISLSEIAKQIEYSTAVMSEWVKGNYAGDVDAVTRAVNLWIERTARRRESKGYHEYVETWVCEEMQAMIRFADRRQKMCAIVALPGSGKGMVIQALAEQLNGLVITAESNTATPRKLTTKLAMELGINPAGTMAVVLERIVERLKNRSRMVFIDEAQQLDRRCFSTIRYIYDMTKVPIVMLGSREIFQLVDDRDFAANGGGQFHRRCLKLDILNRAANEESPDGGGKQGRPLFTKEEIKKFLSMKRVRLANESTFDLLWRISNTPGSGSLGMVNDIVESCMDIYKDEQLSRAIIFQVMPLLLDADAVVVLKRAEELPESGIAPSRRAVG